ncbi:pinin [Harpegnathos saltator]|uniref:Pinin n=1 Tax=Harpegnathos saltator TaxID=610380 RepID=E2C475_HARSA|nr:pinin [Harpegnathos saltator]EFN77246.1 Pinin [Harpegnathos saltator]
MRKLDYQETWKAEGLEAQLEAARDDLRGLDRSIRKILGRDLPDGENGPLQPPRISQKRPLQEDRRRMVTEVMNNELSGGKRRWQSSNTEPKTVFSRLSARVPSNADDSADEDDSVIKPAVSSRVIATPREIPSRQEVIRRERTDERSRQRNKRMFGALLGTLQKFRQEETKLKAKEDKKAEVEARVEEAKRREKEELRRERQQLFLSRKRQLAEVRALEIKLARSRQFQDWRNAQLFLASFIKTRAQPSIYYVPKRKHPQTELLLAQSTKELYEEIEKREKILIEQLNLIEAQIGLGKHSQNFDGSASLNTVVPSRSLEDGEENRDPNPEHSIEATTDNNAAVSTIQSIISETFDDDQDMEKKDEVQLDQVQQDKKNG